METQDAPSNPAAAALTAEMQDIMTNAQHPLHAGYHRNDPAVMKEIDGKYQKVYGTKPVDVTGGISVEIGGDKQPADAAPPSESDASAATVKVSESLAQLKTEWGADFPARASQIRASLDVLATDGEAGDEAADRFLDIYVAHGGDLAPILKTLVQLGEKAGTV